MCVQVIQRAARLCTACAEDANNGLCVSQVIQRAARLCTACADGANNGLCVFR